MTTPRHKSHRAVRPPTPVADRVAAWMTRPRTGSAARRRTTRAFLAATLITGGVLVPGVAFTRANPPSPSAQATVEERPTTVSRAQDRHMLSGPDEGTPEWAALERRLAQQQARLRVKEERARREARIAARIAAREEAERLAALEQARLARVAARREERRAAAREQAQVEAQAAAAIETENDDADTEPGTLRDVARQMMLDYGYPADQWTYLDRLIMRESGWNPTAQNPSSGAYGLPQALPGDKMASVAPDWRTNPRTQITWMLGYIDGRYGDPRAAWDHSERVGWY